MTGLVTAEQGLALRGELDGEPLVIPLLPGANHLGSAPSCDLVLKTPGVSKRHADLYVEGDRVSVEDLASKNGTFVNQRRVEHATIGPGDRVAFGTVSMVLEPIDLDEARIAVDLGPPRKHSPRAPTTETFNASTTLDGLVSPGLRWASDFVEALGLPAGTDPISAGLRSVVRDVPLRGLCLFSATEARELVFTASAGDLGAIDLVAVGDALADRSQEGALEIGLCAAAATPSVVGEITRDFAPGAKPGSLFLLTTPSRHRGLLAWGDRIGSAEVRALLRLVLAISDRFTKEAPGAAKWPEFALRRATRPAPELEFPQDYVVGESPAMVDFYRQLQPVVRSDLPILVLGETGTGKESVAQILHGSSGRRHKPLVTVNCAAIPQDLIEAELFGIGGGVATGVSARTGKFQEADGGTLFLDEIGDLPLPLQAKLLRALQDGDIRPVGRKAEPVDVRIVAATNGDLEHQMDAGLFRRDLYYRLAGLVVHVPPLRMRAGDVPALVTHFLRREAEKTEKAIRGLTVGAMKRLSLRPWPGNVRELEFEIRRLVYRVGPNQLISAEMVTAPERCDGAAGSVDFSQVERLDLGDIEKSAVTEALRRTDGQITEAARQLGITRQSLRRRMRRHGL